jgi:hypothetical protein
MAWAPTPTEEAKLVFTPDSTASRKERMLVWSSFAAASMLP